MLSRNEQINQLLEMFPDTTRENIATCLSVHGTVARAALSLSMSTTLTNDDGSDNDLVEPAFPPTSKDNDYRPASLPSILEELKGHMSNEKEKVKVDEEDLLSDAMAYYKDPNFDPKKKLRVVYNKQPAADTGGVTRQFLHTATPPDVYKIPTDNSQVVASGIMKLVGTIIVHSILQGGPGLRIFSPSVYHYLATGDVDGAIQTLSMLFENQVLHHHFLNQKMNSDFFVQFGLYLTKSFMQCFSILLIDWMLIANIWFLRFCFWVLEIKMTPDYTQDKDNLLHSFYNS